jgi:hypothetical protein
LIEIVVAAAIIALGWEKSFKTWASEAPVIGSRLTAQSPAPQTRSALPATTATPPPTSFTGHIYYTDEHGKSYWLDAQGKRHYKP